MTGWSLSPEGIKTILTSTETAVTDVHISLSGLVTIEPPLRAGAGKDGNVLAAVAGLLEDQKPTIDGALNRYDSAAAATGLSTNAFLAGDEQMAATLAADAGKASSTDLVTRFAGGAR